MLGHLDSYRHMYHCHERRASSEIREPVEAVRADGAPIAAEVAAAICHAATCYDVQFRAVVRCYA